MGSVAGQDYKLKKGDTLDAIAKKHGLKNGDIIWKAPENKALAAKRGKPEKLQIGDTVVIPPSEKALKEARQENAKLTAFFAGEIQRTQDKVAVYNKLIADMQSSTKEIVAELEQNKKKMKFTGEAVDMAKTLIDLGSSIAKLSSIGLKAAKASEGELAKLTKEAVQQAKEIPQDALKEHAVKAVGALKTHASPAFMFVGTVAESYEKMTSPSFWANTWVQMTQNGKSWSEAVSSDIGEDIEEQIKKVEETSDRQIRTLEDRKRQMVAHVAELKSQASKLH